MIRRQAWYRWDTNGEKECEVRKYLAESYFENSDAFYEAQVLAEMTVEDCENAVREMFDPEKSSISVVDNK